MAAAAVALGYMAAAAVVSFFCFEANSQFLIVVKTK
jgi:hypothetical protein